MNTRILWLVMTLTCLNAHAGIISPNPKTDCLMAVAKATSMNLHMNPTGTALSVVDSSKVYADPTMRVFTNRSAIGINGGTNGCVFDNKSNAYIELGSRLGAVKDLNVNDEGFQACLSVTDASFAPIQAALTSRTLSPAPTPAVAPPKPILQQVNFTPRGNSSVSATPPTEQPEPVKVNPAPPASRVYTGKIPDYGRGDSDTTK